MNHSITSKLVAAVIAYTDPIKIKEAAILKDECPRHGDDCPTAGAHCKECGKRLHIGYCVNQVCIKVYEGKQTTRL